MKPQEFCYWLMGYFEIAGGSEPTLTAEQVKIIKNHLALVFKHSIDTPDPTGELQAILDGVKPPKSTELPPSGAVYKMLNMEDSPKIVKKRFNWPCWISHDWTTWGKPRQFGFDLYQRARCRKCGALKERHCGTASRQITL